VTGKCRLLDRVRYQVTSDLRGSARPSKDYRGSRRRLKKIRLRGNSSWELWVVLAWVVFVLFVLIPRMIRHMH